MLEELVCISFRANTLVEGMDPTIPLPNYGYIVVKIGLFKLGIVTNLEEGKFLIQNS